MASADKPSSAIPWSMIRARQDLRPEHFRWLDATALRRLHDEFLKVSDCRDEIPIRLRLPIAETLQARWLRQDVADAELESFYRQSGQPEHSVEIFERLACLPPEHFSNIQLKKTTSEESPYDIIDGVHRAALLWHAGFDGIPATMISMTDSKVLPRLARARLRHLARRTRSENFSNGWHTRRSGVDAYHSFTRHGLRIAGQRDPALRVAEIEHLLPLNGHRVLDLGCSLGGMHVSC